MIDLIKLGKKLFPINRSLTGKGSLKTLKIIQRKIPKGACSLSHLLVFIFDNGYYR